MKKTIFLILVFLLSSNVVFAESDVVASEDVTSLEVVEALDLGIEDPILLPDSPFYFVKEWRRGVSSFFTFDSVKKAEKELQYANERLMEAKKVAEKMGKEEVVAKAIEKYDTAMEKTRIRIEAAKQERKDDVRFQELMDKFTEDGFNQHRLISVIDKKIEAAPEEIREKIRAVKEEIVEKIGEVLVNVDGDKIEERLNKVIEKVEEGKLKHFRNLEVLKDLEEKLPEQAIPAIKRAQENSLSRLKANIQNLPEEKRKEILENYIEKVDGDEVRHLEILDEIKEDSSLNWSVRSAVEAGEARAVNRLEKRVEGTENIKELEILRSRIEAGPTIQKNAINLKSNLLRDIETKKSINRGLND